MRWRDQHATNTRYGVIPRTLSFLTHDRNLLLVRRGAEKRPWPGKLNGLGGHVEAREDILSSAHRETREEVGREANDLSLRGIVHVCGTSNSGVILFVFVGNLPSADLGTGAEGELEWYPLDRLPWSEMVPDLPMLLPRLLSRSEGEEPLYAHYTPSSSGEMIFCFHETEATKR
ncbi:MAG: NUDIX domain-containing protein [Anaerolineales bacterium]